MVVNWHSKKCCYLSFCLHLPPEGVVFVPIVPLPLGDLPQSGVWHDISHRTEWWERHLVCLICKCVLLLHLIGLHITTHCASVFFFFCFLLSEFVLSAYVWCWSAKGLRRPALITYTLVSRLGLLEQFLKYSHPSKFQSWIKCVSIHLSVQNVWNFSTSQLHTQLGANLKC